MENTGFTYDYGLIHHLCGRAFQVPVQKKTKKKKKKKTDYSQS